MAPERRHPSTLLPLLAQLSSAIIIIGMAQHKTLAESLHIVSLNVKGLNHPIKRRKIFEYIAKSKGDIILLQETKLSEADVSFINYNWISHTLCSPAEHKKKGVITLIAKKSNFSVVAHKQDTKGRILVTHLQRGEDPIHVVNIYGPNTDVPEFWEEVSQTLEDIPQEELTIVGGDFNLPLDPLLDRQSSCKFQPSRSHKALKKLCSRFNRKDSWRLQHPDTKDFTFYSAPHNSYSRIDYLLISNSFTHLIDETDIAPILVSDQACIYTKLAGTHSTTPTKRWRFNEDVLADPANKIKIEKAILEYIAMNDQPEVNISTV